VHEGPFMRIYNNTYTMYLYWNNLGKNSVNIAILCSECFSHVYDHELQNICIYQTNFASAYIYIQFDAPGVVIHRVRSPTGLTITNS